MEITKKLHNSLYINIVQFLEFIFPNSDFFKNENIYTFVQYKLLYINYFQNKGYSTWDSIEIFSTYPNHPTIFN